MDAKHDATKQPMSHWKNKREIKIYLEKMKMETMIQKSMEHSKKSRWEVYSDTNLP